jgi:hypothetical protein
MLALLTFGLAGMTFSDVTPVGANPPEGLFWSVKPFYGLE